MNKVILINCAGRSACPADRINVLAAPRRLVQHAICQKLDPGIAHARICVRRPQTDNGRHNGPGWAISWSVVMPTIQRAPRQTLSPEVTSRWARASPAGLSLLLVLCSIAATVMKEDIANPAFMSLVILMHQHVGRIAELEWVVTVTVLVESRRVKSSFMFHPHTHVTALESALLLSDEQNLG